VEAEAAEWLIRRDRPRHSAEADEEFSRWLEADKRHRAAYVRLEAGWKRSQRLATLRPFDEPADPDLLAPVGRDQRFERANPYRRASIGLAAATIIAAILTYFAIDHANWRPYETVVGGFERVELPDGSTMRLNTDTKIRTHITPTRRRVVLVRGEALFSVAPDKKRPFDVEVNGTTVQAVGTEFSVRLHEDKRIEVLVSEGLVAVDSSNFSIFRRQPRPILARGDRAIVPDKQAAKEQPGTNISPERIQIDQISEAAIDRKHAWISGGVWFEGESLNEAVAEFNRYNRSRLIVTDPGISQAPISGRFMNNEEGRQAFIGALNLLLNVHVAPPVDSSGDIRLRRRTESVP